MDEKVALGEQVSSTHSKMNLGYDTFDFGDAKQAELKLEILPSELMLKAWAAITDSERHQLTPQFRVLLKLKAKSSMSRREQSLVDRTFYFLGGYGLPLFELALNDGDPIVRQHALLELPPSLPF